jgi:integrase
VHTATIIPLKPVPQLAPARERPTGINRLDHLSCATKLPEAGEKVLRLSDGGGLYLEVKDHGDGRVSRHWYCAYYGLKGQRTRLALGRFPDETTLAAARAERDLIKTQLAANPPIDPALARKLGKLKAVEAGADDARFGAVADRWLAQFYPAAKTPKNTLDNASRLKRYLVEGYAGAPGFGGLPTAAVERKHVFDLLDAAERHSPRTRKFLQTMVRRIFSWAKARDLISINPIANVDWSDAYKHPDGGESFAAATDPTDFGTLLRKLAAFKTSELNKHTALRAQIDDRIVRGYFNLLALTFVRPSELRLAEWREVRLEADVPVWIVPKGRLKQRTHRKRKGVPLKDHRVPLAPQAVAILRELHALTGAGRFVFPSALNPGKPVGRMTMLNKLRQAGVEQEEHTFHGFRACARTMIADHARDRANGNKRLFLPHVVEFALNHIEDDRYYEGDQFEDRVPLMAWWANWIDRCRDGAKR